MKKQVTFAQSHTERQRQKHRLSLPTESKCVPAANDVQFIDQRIYRRFSTPSDRRATVHIPRSMATAPFLKHSGLTPAQREYLYSVAASQSGDRVRDIITTHYMNIVHRCIRAGHSIEKDYIYPVILQGTVEPPQTEVVSKPPPSKQKGRTGAAARNYGRTSLPKINRRQPRRLKTPVTKQRKKPVTPPKLKKKKPSVTLPVLSPDEDDDDDDDDILSFKDSLSDGLSSLSLTDWDNDFLSDLDT